MEEFFKTSTEKFKPFQIMGFTVEQVSDHIDSIFKSHSADIHTLKQVEGLVLSVKGKMTPDESKVIEIIVEECGWKSFISIE